MNDNELEIAIALRQNRINRLGEQTPTIKGWNNYADAWHHITRPVDLTTDFPISLDERFHFLEKLVHHHFGHAIEHSLSDAGDQTADLRIRAVFKHRLPASFI